MPSDLERIQEVLRKSHLCTGLSDDKIAEIGQMFAIQQFKRDEIIMHEGDPPDYFWMVYRGHVKVSQKRDKTQQHLAVLEPGDYFGEEALYSVQSKRNATVTAVDDTVFLFRMDREHFLALIKAHRVVRENLLLARSSRRLARQKRFDFIPPDETIYLLERRHPILFLYGIALPVLIALLSPAFFWAANYFAMDIMAIIGWVLLGLALAGAGWQYIDWTNDYYIVTNRRVIWLERILFLYDNRQETPLGAILSLSLNSSQVGRIIGYGDVLVKTFAGGIALRAVGRPNQVRNLIEEHWKRSQEQRRAVESDAIRRTIRGRIQPPDVQPNAPLPPAKPVAAKPPATPPQRDLNAGLALIWQDFIRMRFQQGDTITYRKHFLILLYQVGLPSIVIIAAIGVLSWLEISVWISLLLLTFPLTWWMYQYVDWRNDIFRVTRDRIYDIDRKPLGREEKKEAPLDSILSLEVQKRGVLNVLFNFGDVIIDVGSGKFVFETIFNPAQAQQDIFQHMDAAKRRKQEDQEAKERARMAQWIEIYHQESNNIRPGSQPDV